MKSTQSVVIDCFPDSALRYQDCSAIVVVDVIRATTTATTAISLGRRVFPARTSDEAWVMAKGLKDPLLVGELGGNMPYGFHITNSPALIAERDDIQRPMILVSSSGIQLLINAGGHGAVYIACLRNFERVVQHMANRYPRVALLGAGTRGQFRREDQMLCAWMAERFADLGFVPENDQTIQYMDRWRGKSLEVICEGRSAQYLLKTGQEKDLEFILAHINDLEDVPVFLDGEVVLNGEK